ncbi:hypothetical protein [Brachybacterium vulturis]|uniref:hypothetical protein n=1 Tax=Brachybacterium vulturis TaxID=2017484 RepID=UPI0037360535
MASAWLTFIPRPEGSFGADYRVVLAGAITAMLPVVITFFFTQRYFFRGIEEGGLTFTRTTAPRSRPCPRTTPAIPGNPAAS